MTKFLAAATVLAVLAAGPVHAQTKIQIGCTATSGRDVRGRRGNRAPTQIGTSKELRSVRPIATHAAMR
jgi:hypothetical protein